MYKVLSTVIALQIVIFSYAQDSTSAANQNTTDTSIAQRTNIDTASKNLVKQAVDSSNRASRDINTLIDKKDKINNEIANLESRIKKGENVYSELSNKIKQSQKIVEDLQKKIENINEQNAIVKKQFDETSEAKDSLVNDTAKLKKDILDLSNEKNKNEKDIESQEAKLKSQQATISKQLDSLEVIAEIKMNDSIRVFDSQTKKSYWTHINKIHINVKEGLMTEIVVTTDSGIYRNKTSIIDLVHFGMRGSDTLRYEPQKYRKNWKSLYVYLDDAITYTPMQSYSDLPYADFNITLLPTDKDRSYLLRESTSINTYFTVAAFTDIKGISGEPNGLAQFTADAKFITNTRNFKNGAIVPLHFLSLRGGLAKFDNDFKGTQIYNEDSVSRKDLLQRSTYSIGVKLNLLRGFGSPYPRHLISDWQINVGYNFIGSKIFDTLFKDEAKTVIDTNFRNVTQNQWYIEPILTLSRHRNFSLNISLPIYLNSIKESAKIDNRQNEFWAAPGISLMYFGKRDVGNKLFFRYNHFINLKNKTQAFSQMQLGYSVNITEVWDSNKTSK